MKSYSIVYWIIHGRGFFEKQNKLDKLEAFTSFYGADFYELKRNVEKITLTKKEKNRH